MEHAQNIAVTCVVEYRNQFLLVKRSEDSENFPSLWAFPGGRVDLFETVVDAMRREVYEETGLKLDDRCVFLDTYFFGRTVGVAFLVCSKNDKVVLSNELVDYLWVDGLQDLERLNCIPGIYNHLVRATHMLKLGRYDSLEEINLTKEKYINQ